MKKTLKNVFRPLWHINLRNRVFLDCYNKKNKLKLLDLKNKYENRRCFIIGNGPSLKIDDLELIKNEITFAANRIYVLYDKTQWRPDYYFCQDPTVLSNNIVEIRQNVESYKLIKPTGYKNHKDKNAVYFNVDYDDYKNNTTPRFSDDISKVVYDGYTVTYSMIQFACYMGFKEIYLLGVDFNYSSTNIIEKGSYADERMYDKNKVGSNPDLEFNLKAYISSKEYAEKNGIEIINLTRGGKLEVFKRINLDDII